MSIETDRFDDEGGAMQPVTPTMQEREGGPMVLAMALSAASGFAMALLLTWIF